MANPVAFFEITSPEAGTLIPFYSELFGWKIDADNPYDYGLIDTGAEPEKVGGGIGSPMDPSLSGLRVYVAVDDVEAYLAKAVKLGGKTLQEPYDLPGIGRFAVFTDPAGHQIGLWKR